MKTTKKTNGSHILFTGLTLLILVLTLASPGIAENKVSYEGSIQGAICTHYKQQCPVDEAHLALETDFVLLLDNGEHYFMPNLSRVVKARFANKKVRVHGEKKEHVIWLNSLDVKKGNKYHRVWNYKNIFDASDSDGG